jgi:hypothetical protein
VSQPTNDRTLPYEVVMHHENGVSFYSGAATLEEAQELASDAMASARERGVPHTYEARAKQ